MFAFFADTYSRYADIALALDYARKSVALARDLVARGIDTKWGQQDVRADLSASLYFVSHTLKTQGDIAGALEPATETLHIKPNAQVAGGSGVIG